MATTLVGHEPLPARAPRAAVDSVAHKINREAVVVLGWGRAILLQLAHPLVAQGVADHSQFGDTPGQYLQRAWRTIQAMLSITFGTDEEARSVAQHINAIHARVHGTLRASAGRYPAGTPYSARDPELLLWVHATLVDSLPLAYEHFVGPLSAAEKDRYCREAAESAPLFDLEESLVPATTAALSAYIHDMKQQGRIAVTDTARSVAQALLAPHLGPATPAFGAARLATIGLLPSDIREAYGFTWNAMRARRFDRLAWTIRRTSAVLPRIVREWPQARSMTR